MQNNSSERNSQSAAKRWLPADIGISAAIPVGTVAIGTVQGSRITNDNAGVVIGGGTGLALGLVAGCLVFRQLRSNLR